VGTEAEVGGLLMCRAGPHRLAFLPEQVRTIEAGGTRSLPSARSAYALTGEGARVLLGDDGEAVSVDSLEVSQQALTLLAVPPMLQMVAGSAVCGFVANADGLWPVLRLREFCAFLDGGR
jgi:hypothetical protein